MSAPAGIFNLNYIPCAEGAGSPVSRAEVGRHGKNLVRGLDSSLKELYCGGMATLIYSTGYNECGGVWFGHGHMTGFFQIKEETESWSPSAFSSPAGGYYYNDFGNMYQVDIIDYEEARHWPHP